MDVCGTDHLRRIGGAVTSTGANSKSSVCGVASSSRCRAGRPREQLGQAMLTVLALAAGDPHRLRHSGLHAPRCSPWWPLRSAPRRPLPSRMVDRTTSRQVSAWIPRRRSPATGCRWRVRAHQRQGSESPAPRSAVRRAARLPELSLSVDVLLADDLHPDGRQARASNPRGREKRNQFMDTVYGDDAFRLRGGIIRSPRWQRSTPDF